MPFFRLVSLHGSLKKLLPEDYSQFEKMEDPGDVQREAIRPFKRSSMEFNGVQVKLKIFLKTRYIFLINGRKYYFTLYSTDQFLVLVDRFDIFCSF